VNEVQREYKEKRKNDNNVTYQKERESLKKSSVVNPSQLQFHNNPQEDDEFLKRLFSINKEYGLLGSQLQGATKLKEKYKAPLIAQAQKYNNNVKLLYESYLKKLPIIKLNKDYQTKLENYIKSLEQINNKLELLARVGFCGKGRINREVNRAGELLQAHDNVILAWLSLEPRDIILNSGEVIIEKIVEAEPSEEKIRALVAKYIKDFLPKQKAPETIIKTETKTVYVDGKQDLLGKAHQLLYGQKNYAEALKILRELNTQGNPDAQATLGTVYMEGLGVRKDIEKAAEYFKKAIKADSSEAMYKYGTLLEKGLYKETEDRQTNIVRAIEYYRKAALKDELNALTDLAFLLENGKYMQKDINEAQRLLKRAAELYYPRGLNNLGSMYYKGLITDEGRPNEQKAFQYFKLAADQGYPKAFTNLGICYEKGKAVPKDLLKALEFYKIAAELRDVDGIFHLGYYTLDNATRTNDEEQYAEAADLFREAISLDPEYAEAYYYMGFLFENGLGVDRDMKTAFRFYRKAGEIDHAKSWTKLGTFYAKGFGVTKNSKNSIIAYERGAELGDDEAMNILGIIYEEGIEVPPDFTKAFEYYKMAAKFGNAKARLNIGLMHERGRIDLNGEDAVTMYAEAADMGNVTAHMMLSTRDINTIYKGSMSKILGREDNTTTMYDGVDMETLVMEQRPGSPQDNLKIPNATSQYVKGKDLKYQ